MVVGQQVKRARFVDRQNTGRCTALAAGSGALIDKTEQSQVTLEITLSRACAGGIVAADYHNAPIPIRLGWRAWARGQDEVVGNGAGVLRCRSGRGGAGVGAWSLGHGAGREGCLSWGDGDGA